MDRLTSIVRAVTGRDPFRRPGCTPEDLAALEGAVGLELPADYRRLLSVIDGQDPAADLGLPPVRSRLLSASEVRSLWQELLEFGEDVDPSDAFDANGVLEVPFHRRRIPIAEDHSAGVFLFLDFLPGAGGREGQIIANATESDMVLVAGDVTELIGSYVRILEEGLASVEVVPDEYSGGFRVAADGEWLDVDRFVALIHGD
jgi:cell wall assembly regulator SMI1